MIVNNIGNLVEIAAEGTNYLTQSYEAYQDRAFYKRKVLVDDISSNWKEISEKEYTDYQQNTPPEKPKRTALTPMFESAKNVRFNDETGFYELNGLKDITEREMCDIYQEGPLRLEKGYPHNLYIRTNIVRSNSDWIGATGDSMCNNCFNLEIIEAGGYALNITKLYYSFRSCPKLRRIQANLWIQNMVPNTCFVESPNIEYIGLYKPACDLDFKLLSKLNTETFDHLLQYPGKNPIVITVHPDVYAKLTDPNNVEWSHIVPDAQVKQITFATV